MSFEKPPGLKNTHPTEYQCVAGSSKIIKINTDPGFFVRAIVKIPIVPPGPIVAVSSNENVIPPPTFSNDGETAEVTFCARTRSDPLGTTTTIRVGVADAAGKISFLIDSLDVVVGDRGLKTLIVRVGSGSVAAETLDVTEYKLGTVLKFTDGTPRADMIKQILAASKKAPKPVPVATKEPNTLGTPIRHLVFGCHAKEPNILNIGEGFRRANRPDKIASGEETSFGNDPLIGDAAEFVLLNGSFKVVWLASCEGGGITPGYRDFIRGVATKMNCFALAAFTGLSVTPRETRVGGKRVFGPLLKDQVDMYANGFIAGPSTTPGAPGGVVEGDFLRARKRLGFSIAEYDGLPVDDDPN